MIKICKHDNSGGDEHDDDNKDCKHDDHQQQ